MNNKSIFNGVAGGSEVIHQLLWGLVIPGEVGLSNS